MWYERSHTGVTTHPCGNFPNFFEFFLDIFIFIDLFFPQLFYFLFFLPLKKKNFFYFLQIFLLKIRGRKDNFIFSIVLFILFICFLNYHYCCGRTQFPNSFILSPEFSHSCLRNHLNLVYDSVEMISEALV